jgi:hypothetical protein
MTGNAEFAINEALYQWCVRAFSLLRGRLGIDIKLHGGEASIAAGQIFLFNHFARFETIVPQYFIHQATGAYAAASAPMNCSPAAAVSPSSCGAAAGFPTIIRGSCLSSPPKSCAAAR